MGKIILAVIVALLAVAGTGFAHVTGSHSSRPTLGEFRSDAWHVRGNLRDVKGARCLPPPHFAWKPAAVSPIWRDHKLSSVRHRVQHARARQTRCADYGLWECVHRHEGDWQDGGWPYWGGLQMGELWIYHYLQPFAPGSVPPRGSVGRNGWTNAPSPDTQMRAADAAWDRNGHSVSWLDSQFPGTSSECAAYL